MNAIIWVFSLIKVSLSIEYTLTFNSDGRPINVNRELNVGDSITIRYATRTFLVVIDSPKFYLDVQLTSNQREFHATEPAIYALGDAGGLRYTALENGVHKFVVWRFGNSYCQHVSAYGRQYFRTDIALKARYSAFIQTDSSVSMNVKSDKLGSYQWVHVYNEDKKMEYTDAYGSFNIDVNVPVVLQATNFNKGINVEITSNGDAKYNYGSYSDSDLAVTSVPFYYKTENNKVNMKDGYYDPSNVDNGNTETEPTKDPSGATKTPEADLKAEEQESESELSGGEKAGIAVGSIGGVGTIGTVIGVITRHFMKAVKKRNNDSTDEDSHHNKQNAQQKNTQKNSQTNSQASSQSSSQNVILNLYNHPYPNPNQDPYPNPNQDPPCEV